MERYQRKARTFATIWFLLLFVLFVAIFISKFSPAVYRTVHLSLIIKNLIQLVHTMQFYAAVQLLRGLEIMLSIGTGRKQVNSIIVNDNSGSVCASDMIIDTDVRELYSVVQKEPSNTPVGPEVSEYK